MFTMQHIRQACSALRCCTTLLQRRLLRWAHQLHHCSNLCTVCAADAAGATAVEADAAYKCWYKRSRCQTTAENAAAENITAINSALF